MTTEKLTVGYDTSEYTTTTSTHIEKTLKENTDKLLTKIALDYANNLITVPAIFERLEEELPILITQALQEQDRESRREVLLEIYKFTKSGKFSPASDTGWSIDLSDVEKKVEDYARQHNVDLHEN